MSESTIVWVACTQLPRDIVSHRSQTFGGRLICLTCSFVIISHRHELTKKLCASSTGKLFHVTTPLRLFHYDYFITPHHKWEHSQLAACR